MANTIGLVQKLTILPGGVACAWVGPSPTNTTILTVLADSSDSAQRIAFNAAMVDALSTAMMARREVTANHDDNDSQINWISIQPT